jgi:hypothetical protein
VWLYSAVGLWAGGAGAWVSSAVEFGGAGGNHATWLMTG